MKIKLIYLVYLGVFIGSSLLFEQSGSWKYESMGQIAGLGSVVVGYFATRKLLKSKSQA